MEEHLDRDMVEACAEAAHEANRVWSKSLGDTSHKHWADAPDGQKESSRAGVREVLRLYREHTPQEQIGVHLHNAWMATKFNAGWTYGPVKDEELKQHPCLVVYDSLPPEQQIKDSIYYAVVLAFAKAWWRRPV